MTPDDPITRFAREYERAGATEPFEVSRCALATADGEGRPAVRFVFITNFQSAKAKHLSENPDAEIAFHWHTTGVQVRVRGRVARVSDEEADDYFVSRDRGSQIGAWASPQSEVLRDRHELMELYVEHEKRFAGQAVLRPAHWGGWRLVPEEWEFWQGRPSRLHDRFRYRPVADGWKIDRLAP